MEQYRYIVVSDIGSTTTKGLLLADDSDSCRVLAIANSPTTVEKPLEDVRIGLYNSIRSLEVKAKVDLLKTGSVSDSFTFRENTSYLTTSSAGGGLQILVVGLSLNESASSAQRAAFGAGGVILETLAINDNRTAVEQIGLIDLLRPDIILFSGGVEGGAYASVIRMGEILKVSNPHPKFGVETKIPLIYAGNSEAREFIKTVFGGKFDLHFVDNIRPTMKEENLSPARNEIHRIFMENVMEQAPGYSHLKELVSDSIIPTPTGVLKSLETFSRKISRNVIAFDIGGATTDIFSNIFERYYRTVSANYGMSYSIANVMADSGFPNIRRWLPNSLSDNYIRNYICNKMLYPTYIPENKLQQSIEHAAAKEAVRMSAQHHLSMNFRIQSIGHLDRIKDKTCKFHEAMYYEKSRTSKRFFLKDFDVILAAGGIVTGTTDIRKIVVMISDSMNIHGLTEVWSDKHFLSPHLGKLSEVYPEAAQEILFKTGYKKLGILVKPLSKTFKKKVKLLTIEVNDHNNIKIHEIYNEQLIYIDISKQADIVIECSSKCDLGENKKIELQSEVPLFIDTRKISRYDFQNGDNELVDLFDIKSINQDLETSFINFTKTKQIINGRSSVTRTLPYPGLIYVEEGQEVNSETLLGEIKFEPPRLFILNLITTMGINKKEFNAGLQISAGDEVNNGQKIFILSSQSLLKVKKVFECPVRGIVENINFETGSIYLREVQDYPIKPLRIKVAAAIGIKPKHINGYLRKKKGEFVRTGDTLAKNMRAPSSDDDFKEKVFLSSPTTGTITDIDNKKGTITIQYQRKPIKLLAGISGKVTKISEDKAVKLEYEGITIPGIIGFGKEIYGRLIYFDSFDSFDFSKLTGKIAVYPHQVDLEFLKRAEEVGVKGLIIPSINNIDYIEFSGKEIGVALTGNEAIPYPIIITEGFGNFSMNAEINEIVKKSSGEKCFMQTFTQIRAGVTRPKIIITPLNCE